MSPTSSLRATEIVQKTEDTSVTPCVALVPENAGIIEKVKVYSMETKDGIVQIIGSIGNKIVVIKARVQEMGSEAVVKVKPYVQEVGNTLKAKTVFLQDGYVYIASAVEGQVAYVKAKVAEPIKSCALSLYESSKERMEPALQKLKPYYVRVQNGVADIVGIVNNKVVVIRTQLDDRFTTVRMWTLRSLDEARVALYGYTSPLLSRAISLRHSAATKVDHIFVSIRDGAVHLKGVVGERILNLQTKLSETAIFEQMLKGLQSAKKSSLELTTRLVEIVSDAYGKGRDTLKLIQCSVKDTFLYITCQAKDRFVVVRIKVTEIAQYLQSRSLELYAATRTSITNACNVATTQILNGAAVTRTKAVEAGQNARVLAANPDAQAAAAGAAALGASGGVTGLFVGAAVGVVCALPAAFFTFGLSIPVGAAVGAGGGLCVGGSAGAVAGGVAGYKAHKEKDAIGSSFSGALANAKARKDKAFDSASNLRSHLTERISGHTGGTAFA